VALDPQTLLLTRPRDLYGKGLSFPPRVGDDGRLAWSGGEQNVRENIRVLLMTENGERVMREEFGGGLGTFLFEPNTPATHRRIQERVTRALDRWEPRVAVERVDVRAAEETASRVNITITYRLVATDLRERVGLSLDVGA
jgi:hypothetical protein